MGEPYAEVIGDPIAHSKSPIIHNHWLKRLSMTGDYRARQVKPGELSTYLEERRSDPDWRGCNLTIPHKEAALDRVSVVDPTARALGAVNCIVPTARGLHAYNSDVDGIASALADVALEDRKVVVIGGGGAARAALAYLAKRRVRAIDVLVRNPERARTLASLGAPDLVNIRSFKEGPRSLAETALVINASPLGMTGYPAIPSELLAAVRAEREATLFDMVYDPLTTAFLAPDRAQRIDGLTMLLGQAARAFELFFGACPPPVDQELRDLLL